MLFIPKVLAVMLAAQSTDNLTMHSFPEKEKENPHSHSHLELLGRLWARSHCGLTDGPTSGFLSLPCTLCWVTHSLLSRDLLGSRCSLG